MLEIASRDRLQPSLLDRLTDEQPLEKTESVESRVLSRRQLRAAVLRDLSWLFNAIRPEPEASSTRLDEIELWRRHPAARKSILNFGLPALSGSTKSSLDMLAVETAIREAVRTFEPRIDPATLSVKIVIDHKGHHNTLQLTIRGHLWAQPMPLELLLAADVDLETGATVMRDLRS